MQEVDDICGSSNTTYPLARKTARLNNSLADFDALAMLYDKSWHYDDASVLDHDFGKFAAPGALKERGMQLAITNIRKGWTDYPFTLEFLGIKAVFIKDQNGHLMELFNEDYFTGSASGWVEGPHGWRFKFVGQSLVFADGFAPNYDMVDGLQLLVNRNSSRFTIEDTEKELGIPILFHEWACWKAALPFLIKNKLPQKNEIMKLIADKEDPIKPGSIPRYFAGRNQTKKPGFRTRQESNK